MIRRVVTITLFLLLAYGGLLTLLGGESQAITHQNELAKTRIYAYRDWQSSGHFVEAHEQGAIRAAGQWLYTPGEWHGPAGHPRYPAPNFYPLTGTPGGILLARIGETGAIFAVGAGAPWYADQAGLLYFRINDDVLSDNAGWVAVQITNESTSEGDDALNESR